MPSSDEWERLSLYEAGELSEEDARAIEAQLHVNVENRVALECLAEVRLQSLALEDGLSDAQAEALVQRAMVSQAVSIDTAVRGLWRRGGVAVLVLICAWLALWPASPAIFVVTLQGAATVAGEPILLGERKTFSEGILTTGEGSAALVTHSTGTVLVTQNTALQKDSDDVLRLVSGAAVVTNVSAPIRVHTGEDVVEVLGSAVLLMEPETDVIRVTRALNFSHLEMTMKNWWMLGPATAVGALSGAVVTLQVLRGEAKVLAPEKAPLVVAAGQSWNRKAAIPQQAEVNRLGKDAQALLGSEGATREEPADLQSLSRAQLIARVEKLQDEKESMLRGQTQLRRQIVAEESQEGHGKRNYYRIAAEELQESAQKGQLRVRINLHGEPYVVDDAVMKDVRLTPQEVAGIKSVYAQSQQRIRDTLLRSYREIGGDPNVGAGLSNITIFEELRAKSLEGEFAHVVRRIASERAGLAPQSAEGSSLMKTMREMWLEDDRVLTELEALLGTARAEQLLNHEQTNHSDQSWRVGPAHQ